MFICIFIHGCYFGVVLEFFDRLGKNNVQESHLQLDRLLSLKYNFLFVFSNDLLQVFVNYPALYQESSWKGFKSLSLIADFFANLSHQVYRLHINFAHVLTFILRVFKLFNQLFNSSDLSVSLPRFLCHFINCLLNSVHDLCF